MILDTCVVKLPMVSETLILAFGWKFIHTCFVFFQQLLFNHLLQRLYSWFNRILTDRDFFEFICSQELVFLSAVSTQIKIHQDIFDNSYPNAGYRMMMGVLRAQGHSERERVASMHRDDTASIVSSRSQLQCVVRRTYSVPSPKSFMHIDTNHKLIRAAFPRFDRS